MRDVWILRDHVQHPALLDTERRDPALTGVSEERHADMVLDLLDHGFPQALCKTGLTHPHDPCPPHLTHSDTAKIACQDLIARTVHSGAQLLPAYEERARGLHLYPVVQDRDRHRIAAHIAAMNDRIDYRLPQGGYRDLVHIFAIQPFDHSSEMHVPLHERNRGLDLLQHITGTLQPIHEIDSGESSEHRTARLVHSAVGRKQIEGHSVRRFTVDLIQDAHGEQRLKGATDVTGFPHPSQNRIDVILRDLSAA